MPKPRLKIQSRSSKILFFFSTKLLSFILSHHHGIHFREIFKILIFLLETIHFWFDYPRKSASVWEYHEFKSFSIMRSIRSIRVFAFHPQLTGSPKEDFSLGCLYVQGITSLGIHFWCVFKSSRKRWCSCCFDHSWRLPDGTRHQNGSLLFHFSSQCLVWESIFFHCGLYF